MRFCLRQLKRQWNPQVLSARTFPFVHLFAIGFRMLPQHPPFFVFGQHVVDQNHHEPQNNNDEPRPKDGEAKAGNAEAEVLRMSYPPVQPFQDGPSLKKLVRINLNRTDEEYGDPEKEQDRPITRTTLRGPFGGTTICVKKKELSHFVAGYFAMPRRTGLNAE